MYGWKKQPGVITKMAAEKTAIPQRDIDISGKLYGYCKHTEELSEWWVYVLTVCKWFREAAYRHIYITNFTFQPLFCGRCR